MQLRIALKQSLQQNGTKIVEGKQVKEIANGVTSFAGFMSQHVLIKAATALEAIFVFLTGCGALVFNIILWFKSLPLCISYLNTINIRIYI